LTTEPDTIFEFLPFRMFPSTAAPAPMMTLSSMWMGLPLFQVVPPWVRPYRA
jgi:hypothetical protein